MRILLTNKYFFINGGSESVMFQERQFLQGCGHQIMDFSMKDERNIASEYSDYFVANVNYSKSEGDSRLSKIGSALSLIHSKEAVDKISDLIKDFRPHVVHCHNIYHQLTPSIIVAAKKLDVPVVLTLHDYKPICPVYNRLSKGDLCSRCIDGNFLNVIKYRCADNSFGKSVILYLEALFHTLNNSYDHVNAFIAPSQFMNNAISHRFSSSKIHTLYNGVNTSKICVSDEDHGYILYLGRLSPEKGIQTLLEAHDKSFHDLPLFIAGTGPLEQKLRDTFKKPKFIGHVFGDQLNVVIKNCSVIVVPSECYENCPMSVLEAMAYGKPVVATRIGGIPELVSEGETGFLFDMKDIDGLLTALIKLMVDPQLRKQFGRSGRAKVESLFNIDRHNTGLINIYESVIRS